MSKMSEVKKVSYGAVAAKACGSEHEIVDELYRSVGPKKPFDNYFFDIPYLHSSDEIGVSFIEALDAYPDIDIYSYESIQMLIDFHWKSNKTKIKMFRMFPLYLMLGCFWIWSNLVVSYSHSVFSSDK